MVINMKILFYFSKILILILLSACNNQNDFKPKQQDVALAQNTVEIQKPKTFDTTFTDTLINVYRKGDDFYQIHEFRNQNYKIIFHNLVELFEGEVSINRNYFEVYQNDKLLFQRFSDHFVDDSVGNLNKIKNYTKNANYPRSPKKCVMESFSISDAAFYIEQFGNVFKNDKPYMVINSHHNGGNVGGSYFTILEFGDTLRTVLDIFYHHGLDEGEEFYFKDTDGDAIPEVKVLLSFNYTNNDDTGIAMHFQNVFLKYVDDNFGLDTTRMNKPEPNEKQLLKIIKKIKQESYNGDYDRKRLLYYNMIGLTYSGNLKSAYKLLELASKELKISTEEFKREFDQRLNDLPFIVKN